MVSDASWKRLFVGTSYTYSITKPGLFLQDSFAISDLCHKLGGRLLLGFGLWAKNDRFEIINVSRNHLSPVVAFKARFNVAVPLLVKACI